MPRSDDHGRAKDAHYRWALSSHGRLGLAFDAKVARHACGTGPSRLGIGVGTDRRHEREMLNLARCLQASGKRSIELDVDGTMRIQGELGRARAHSQDTEPNHFTANLAQCIDNALKEFVGLHFWDQPLFHLSTQLQIERAPRHDENPVETATADDFGQECLTNGA